jgi:hypothetical protein
MAVKPRRRGVRDRSQLYEVHVPLETREIGQIRRDDRADVVSEHHDDHVRVMDLLAAASHVGQQSLQAVRSQDRPHVAHCVCSLQTEAILISEQGGDDEMLTQDLAAGTERRVTGRPFVHDRAGEGSLHPE